MTVDKIVLITGASGFIAGHTIIKLLNEGYEVRGSVRSLARSTNIKKNLAPFTDHIDKLSFVELDLTSDKGWAEAAIGCSYLLHMASPLPKTAPKDENEIIAPARDGALRALQAGVEAGVKRIVLTSSVAAVLYGHSRDGSRVYDETDWTDLNANIGAYEKSKTIAERSARDFMKAHADTEFVTVNPSLVLGPILEEDYGTSGELIKKLMKKEMPGVPDVGWAVVDVRDVAEAHYLTMISENIDRERFILSAGHASMMEIALILKEEFGSKGYKIPTRPLPDWLLKIVAMFDKTAALAVQELGLRQDLSVERATRLLNWKSRDLKTMVLDMATSMIDKKIV